MGEKKFSYYVVAKLDSWRADKLYTYLPIDYYYLICHKSGRSYGFILAIVFMLLSFIMGISGKVITLDLNCLGLSLSGAVLCFLSGISFVNNRAQRSGINHYFLYSGKGKDGIYQYEKFDQRLKILRAFYLMSSMLGRFFVMYVSFLLGILGFARSWIYTAAFTALFIVFTFICYTCCLYCLTAEVNYYWDVVRRYVIPQVISFALGALVGLWVKRNGSLLFAFDIGIFLLEFASFLLFLLEPRLRKSLFYTGKGTRDDIQCLARIFDIQIQSFTDYKHELNEKEKERKAQEEREKRKKMDEDYEEYQKKADEMYRKREEEYRRHQEEQERKAEEERQETRRKQAEEAAIRQVQDKLARNERLTADEEKKAERMAVSKNTINRTNMDRTRSKR